MSMVITKKAIIENLREVAGRSGHLTRQQFRNSSRRRFASVTVEKYLSGFTNAKRAAKLV